MRPDRRDLHMATAIMWAKRSICQRLQVGAVITTSDMRQVLSIGYNGPAKGLPHTRCRHDQPGNCGCLHAEDNAIALLKGWNQQLCMFVTVSPCETCAQRIIQAGVRDVFYASKYRDADVGLKLLEHVGVRCSHLPNPTMGSWASLLS